ncbi:MAG: dUTP diphosphatase, partial [Ruminococcus sp.]|nr:dUTP diphosphatase [Ruminococcus sp.]
MKLIFKKLKENAVIPSRATPQSAGLDICACIDEPVTLEAREIKMIPSGIVSAVDERDVALLISPR